MNCLHGCGAENRLIARRGTSDLQPFEHVIAGGWITLNALEPSGWPTLCDSVFAKGGHLFCSVPFPAFLCAPICRYFQPLTISICAVCIPVVSTGTNDIQQIH